MATERAVTLCDETYGRIRLLVTACQDHTTVTVSDTKTSREHTKVSHGRVDEGRLRWAAAESYSEAARWLSSVLDEQDEAKPWAKATADEILADVKSIPTPVADALEVALEKIGAALTGPEYKMNLVAIGGYFVYADLVVPDLRRLVGLPVEPSKTTAGGAAAPGKPGRDPVGCTSIAMPVCDACADREAKARAEGKLGYMRCDVCTARASPAIRAAAARTAWAGALLDLDGPARTAELRQMIIDAMDTCEQETDEERLNRALIGFGPL